MGKEGEKRIVAGLAGLAGLAAGLLATDAKAETFGINWYDSKNGQWNGDGNYPTTGGLSVAVAGTDILTASTGGQPPEMHKYRPDNWSYVSYVVGDPKSTLGLKIDGKDWDGDGQPDYLAAPASGADSTLYQALSSQKTLQFQALKPVYGQGFTGGVNVAIVGPDKQHPANFLTAPTSGTQGIASVVQVLSTSDAALNYSKHDPFSFAGEEMAKYDGGIQTAVADVNGDGLVDVVVSAYDPYQKCVQIAVYDRELSALLGNLKVDASGPTSLAAGDFNGDGFPDLAVGAAAGDAPTVRLFQNDKFGNFEFTGTVLTAYNSEYLGGVNVAAGDLNGDGFADIVTTPAAVPEPMAMGVFGSAVLIGCARRKRKPG